MKPNHRSRPGARETGLTLVEVMVTVGVVGVLAAMLPVTAKSKERALRTGCANNIKQITAGVIMFADDQPGGYFTPSAKRYNELNYLWRYMKCSPDIFFCPTTGHRITGSPRKDPDGTQWHFELASVATTRQAKFTSYNIMGWFADRENYWNGNRDSGENSRFVRKSMRTLTGYTHEHEAFGLKGTHASPDTTWVFVDSDSMPPTPHWPSADGFHGESGVNAGFADGHVDWLTQKTIVYSSERSQDNNRARPLPRR